MSFRDFWYMHMFEDGVMKKEYTGEIQWAKSRKLSICRTQRDPAASAEAFEEGLAALLQNYGADKVSDAKDSAPLAALTQSTQVSSRCRSEPRLGS